MSLVEMPTLSIQPDDPGPLYQYLDLYMTGVVDKDDIGQLNAFTTFFASLGHFTPLIPGTISMHSTTATLPNLKENYAYNPNRYQFQSHEDPASGRNCTTLVVFGLDIHTRLSSRYMASGDMPGSSCPRHVLVVGVVNVGSSVQEILNGCIVKRGELNHRMGNVELLGDANEKFRTVNSLAHLAL